ncbi:MAG: helix-turn-helix transcriptional regulator [Nitrospirota bacterium]
MGQTPIDEEDRLLTRAEVELRFGFPTKRFLELAANRGDGPPFVRFGRFVRYRVRDIRDWIEAHRTDPARIG